MGETKDTGYVDSGVTLLMNCRATMKDGRVVVNLETLSNVPEPVYEMIGPCLSAATASLAVGIKDKLMEAMFA